MGLIQSILCSAMFCFERVLTWTCCAFLLVMIMFTLVVMMVYGVSVGYHYAQKELASFAAASRGIAPPTEGGGGRRAASPRSVVRLLAVNRSQEGPLVDGYRTSKPSHIFMEPTITPIIIMETERSQPELSPNERIIAKKLIGRFRRSKNLKRSNNETNLIRFPIPNI